MTGSDTPQSDSDHDVECSPFDLEHLEKLVELMKNHDVDEVELRDDDRKIRVRRSASATTVSAAPVAAVAPAVAPPAATSSDGEAASDDFLYVRSPMVGTFYSRPKPDAESFVRVGDVIEAGKTVCIIEAMKVFNEVESEVSGRVVAILVDDEEHVDHGKPLLKLEKA